MAEPETLVLTMGLAGPRSNEAQELEAGVDSGGTFTDVVLLDANGHALAANKTLTNRMDPCRSIIDGVTEACHATSAAPARIQRLVHATTLVANAVIERRGARTALVTTRGFRDVVQLRRELRYDLFEPKPEFPTPLVPRFLRFELDERVSAEGHVLAKPTKRDLAALCRVLVKSDVESAAIGFLHSYRNSVNEEYVREEIARRIPDIRISISCEIMNEIREYERITAATINAYIQPLVEGYLSDLQARLRRVGCACEPMLVTSSGGTVSLSIARAFPLLLIESGAAAGVWLASQSTRDRPFARADIATFEMGGTTAKVSVLGGGKVALRRDHEVGRTRRFKQGSGLPIGIRVLDILEIGAGGGSIAHVDHLGLLAVGPRSAGADPGPACYGHGGDLPTVTDANLVLGYLGSGARLGRGIPLDVDAATAAIDEHLATQLGLSIIEAAHGVYETVTVSMAEALRARVAESKLNPRALKLVAFGGASGIHAFDVARRLGMREVEIPVRAGVFSAAGALGVPASAEASRTHVVSLQSLDSRLIRDTLDALEAQAAAPLIDLGLPVRTVQTTLDMSYLGQGFEISVDLPLSQDPLVSRETLDAATIAEHFYAAYRRARGRILLGFDAQIVTWRVNCIGPPGNIPRWPRRNGAHPAARRARDIYVGHTWVSAQVCARDDLAAGDVLLGPAIVEDEGSTVLVPPDAELRTDADGTLTLVALSSST